MMNLKKLFHYSFLPILAVLIIPNWSKGTIPNEIDLVRAIIAGTITGGIQCVYGSFSDLLKRKSECLIKKIENEFLTQKK